MPKDKTSKQDSIKKIEEFFNNIKNKTPKEIKKIKRLAMRHNIKLGNKKRLFCKKCFSVFNSSNSETRIKSGFKVIKCKKCGNVQRWRIK